MSRLRRWIDCNGDKALTALMLCLGIPAILIIIGAKWLIFFYWLKEAAESLL